MAKDGWDKFGTITQATVAIMIPVVLYFASQWNAKAPDRRLRSL
jgi:hypothetical protein